MKADSVHNVTDDINFSMRVATSCLRERPSDPPRVSGLIKRPSWEKPPGPKPGPENRPAAVSSASCKGVRRVWIASFTTQCYSWLGKSMDRSRASVRTASAGPRPRGESGLTRFCSPSRSATDRGRTTPRVCSDHSLDVFWIWSVSVRCSSCISPTGAGASESDMWGGQPENWLHRYPLSSSCAVPF